jgi:hypothetical protein
MSNLDQDLELPEELEVRPRESETVSIQIPKDTRHWFSLVEVYKS